MVLQGMAERGNLGTAIKIGVNECHSLVSSPAPEANSASVNDNVRVSASHDHREFDGEGAASDGDCRNSRPQPKGGAEWSGLSGDEVHGVALRLCHIV